MQVSTVGKKLSEVERAYIAGFLDADGAIMATVERHPEKKFGFRVRVIVKITQSKRGILDWFLKKLKIGLVVKNRTTFDWLVRDQKSVYALLTILTPYLKVKNQQARKALVITSVDKNTRAHLMRAARMADALSFMNVRSKNRRINSATMIQDSFSRND